MLDSTESFVAKCSRQARSLGTKRGRLMETGKPIREKILIVDDDASIGRLLGEALEIEGYQPIIYTHPKDVLAISQQETFDLAFVDINLPEMSGLDLAAALKRHDPMREMVIITGYGSIQDEMDAISAGASDYLRKPFSLDDLNLCLERFQSRKALKARLRKVELRYRDLVQGSPLIVYALREDFRLEFINDTCSLVLGFNPEEALHTPNWFLERVHPGDRAEVEQLFRSAFEDGEIEFSVECRFLHKDGRSIPAVLRSIPDFDTGVRSGMNRLEGIIFERKSKDGSRSG